MAGRGEGDGWPADMERRRLAALEKFQRDHPDYVFGSKQLPRANQNRRGGEKCDPASGKPLPSAKTSRKGRPNSNENRWCLATTLELLAEMKAFVRAHKLHCLGEDMEKWKKIVIHLSNPCGLELRKLARSCMVRFDNLRRNYRTHMRSRIEPEVQASMIDYFQICKLHKGPGSTRASTRIVSTMNLALACKGSSPSPPPTPATKKTCRWQTAVYGGHPPYEDEDDIMPSADESTGGSDDDAVELSAASGGPNPPLMNVDTPTRMLLRPAVESSDEESTESSYSDFSSGWKQIKKRPSSQRLRASTVMKAKGRL